MKQVYVEKAIYCDVYPSSFPGIFSYKKSQKDDCFRVIKQSTCKAVIPLFVPAILKSMSPR